MRIFRLVLLALAVLLTAGPAVIAETDEAVRASILAGARAAKFQIFGARPAQPATALRTYAPKRRYAPARPAGAARPVVGADTPAPTSPDPSVDPSADPSAVPQPPVAATPVRRITVVGDSLAELLGEGLTSFYADRPGITITRKVRGSSGIVRDDFFDWRKGMRDAAEAEPAPDAIVVLLGLNDRQVLRDETGAHDPFSDLWKDRYRGRIDVMLDAAAARKVPLLWVSLPVMRAERLSGDAAVLNDMVREKVTRSGGTFVDVWEAFANEQGQYSAMGPDVDGQVTRLRTADGIHFTEAGTIKLAHFVDRALRPLFERKNQAVEAEVVATLPDINDQIRKENARTAEVDFTVPIAPPDGLAIPIVTPRPAAGEVRRLTAPALAEDGRLVVARAQARDPLVQLMFERGEAPPAKIGRIDDFTIGRRAP